VLVHSKVGAKRRREIISAFRSGALRVLFATSLADEGLDVPRASVLVLVAGGRSAGKLEQRAGRVLRPFQGKESGVIHDFMDRGAVFAQAQARARWKVYEKLGYSPELVLYRAGKSTL
jgi:superfamily II DNA or RNA helicase